MKRWLMLVAGLLPGLLRADGGDPKLEFMSLCLRDTTVAAGRREQLCGCERDAFAYGNNGFALQDAIALGPHNWEAPDRRMPADDIGNEVRRIRQACLSAH